jgi:hypothetical protein
MASAAAADEGKVDCLVLNEGGSLSVNIDHEAYPLYISRGTAHRVPRKERVPFDTGIRVIELDIGTRAFSLDTDARQIALSGPKEANISGIDTERWGSITYPAIYMDRDCRLVLIGRANQSAVIRVNPLARVTIDARKFVTPEITIMGNSRANVITRDGTDVSFYDDIIQKRVVVTSGWFGGAPSTPPAPPNSTPTPPPPGMTPDGSAQPGDAGAPTQ